MLYRGVSVTHNTFPYCRPRHFLSRCVKISANTLLTGTTLGYIWHSFLLELLERGAEISYFENFEITQSATTITTMPAFGKKQKSREAGQEFLLKGLAEDQGAFQQQFFPLPGAAHKRCRSWTNNCVNLNMCGQNDRRQLYIWFIVKIPKKRTGPKDKLIRV